MTYRLVLFYRDKLLRAFSIMTEIDMLQEKHLKKRKVSPTFLRAALHCRSQMAIVSCLLPQQLEKRQAENMTDFLAVTELSLHLGGVYGRCCTLLCPLWKSYTSKSAEHRLVQLVRHRCTVHSISMCILPLPPDWPVAFHPLIFKLL